MAIPSTQTIAAWVKEALVGVDWVSLRAAATEVTALRLNRLDDELTDYIEEKLSYIAECLRDDRAECVLDGRLAEIEIDDETFPYIRRIVFQQTDLLERLRGIDPFVFEGVCAKILEQLGAESLTTGKTNDGGVDFIAVRLRFIPAGLPLPQSCHASVIGQAKRYKLGANIGEIRLREFVGAALLRRHVMGIEARLSPLAPTLYAFWTTSDLEINARRFARSVGIWYMDGVTLATYCDSLGLRAYIMSL